MFDERTNTLLKEAATALEEGRELGPYWLRENDVKSDEVMPTMNAIAACIRAFLGAPDDLKATIMAAGVMPTRRFSEVAWLTGIQDWSMKRGLKALETFDPKS